MKINYKKLGAFIAQVSVWLFLVLALAALLGENLLGKYHKFTVVGAVGLFAIFAAIVICCVVASILKSFRDSFLAIFEFSPTPKSDELSKKSSIKEQITWAIDQKDGNPNELDNFERGLAYEFQVGKFLQDQGYEVDFRGINRGKNDGGIDVIARKNGKITLVQCKNYRNADALDQQIVRKFLGDCFVFLNGGSRPYRAEECEFLFFISNAPESSNNIYTYQRYAARKNTPFRLEILPFNEAICEDEEFKQIFEKCLQESYHNELEQAKKALGEK